MNTINNNAIKIDPIPDNDTSCMVTNACGYSLKRGIVIVAISTIITSVIVLFLSTRFLLSVSSEQPYNSDPVLAINLMFALIGTSTALYEIVISTIMLWFLRQKKVVFLLSLWSGSNIVLLVFYFILFLLRSIICFVAKEYFHGVLTIIFGVIYEVVFTYFCMIVCSYENSLDPETIIYV